MFTGIIETKARIISAQKQRGNSRVLIVLPRRWKFINGQSVSIDGVCSTVEEARAAHFEVTYMPETLRVSTAHSFMPGTIVNLERSLRAGDRLDGHIVQGHVEGVGKIVRVRARGTSKEITVNIPRAQRRYILPKGSITLNGVSLTIASRTAQSCTVALIPHTLLHTNLGQLKEGDRVNVETDILVRHLVLLRRK